MINFYAVMTRLVPLMAQDAESAQAEADLFQEKVGKMGFNVSVFGFEEEDDSQNGLDFDAGI